MLNKTIYCKYVIKMKRLLNHEKMINSIPANLKMLLYMYTISQLTDNLETQGIMVNDCNTADPTIGSIKITLAEFFFFLPYICYLLISGFKLVPG